MKLLLKGGHVIDPANNKDEVLDILVDNGKIAKVAKNISSESAEVVNAKGKIVIPGLVDMHVHLREPGREDKETILSGTMAALKGGVTSVLAMPNTTPAMDCAETLKLLKDIIKKTAKVDVFIAAAITQGRAGSATVVDKKGRLVGIFTDGDLRRHLGVDKDLPHRKIKEVMTRNPLTITKDKLAAEAMHILEEKKIDEVPVVDSSRRPIGLLDVQDLLRAGVV